MRIRALAVLSLLSLPLELSAQVGRPPRTGRGAAPQPIPLPPEIAPVSRALAYRRSRWSVDGYSMITVVQAPTGNGSESYGSFGSGTHAGYRIDDRFSATLDATATFLGGSATAQTAEVGTRFHPLASNLNLRPFVDLRGGYTHMHDTYDLPLGNTTVGGPGLLSYTESRYSRGVGGIVGAGFEYTLTASLALSTELLAMRNHMRTYRLTNSSSMPNDGSYWMTSFRYTIGLRYNATRALSLIQNPRM